MNLAKIIKNKIKEEGRQQKWVAEKVDIDYPTFLYKMKNDTFSGYELLRISKLLNINLEKIKEGVEL